LHPALAQHPEHVLWKRDFTGASGLFAFTLKSEPSAERMAAFANGLQLFGIGYSWGGFKSLMVAGQYPRVLPSRYAGQTLIRLSIGLEEPEKLREDLDRGLQRLL
jgi:cystathionine beta-lyase